MAELDPNDTAGFYKYESGNLTWGKWVLNKEYQLHEAQRADYDLPIDGWQWFDSMKEAQAFHGILITEEPDNITNAQN